MRSITASYSAVSVNHTASAAWRSLTLVCTDRSSAVCLRCQNAVSAGVHKFGVPQGCPRALLFVLYTADLAPLIADHCLHSHLYADNTQVYGWSHRLMPACFKPTSVATEDAVDSERRSSFHHWSQEVRAHDASVTRPSLATSTAKDQVQDGCTCIQVSSWHGSTIPDIILHTGLCSNWTFQLAIRDNRPIRCAAY